MHGCDKCVHVCVKFVKCLSSVCQMLVKWGQVGQVGVKFVSGVSSVFQVRFMLVKCESTLSSV